MRNNSSCWICRVRHKKCDEAHPECQSCTTLGLSCLYSDRKPEWMDNGQLQRQTGQRLKAQVKRNARNRRGRQMIDRISQDINDDRSPPTSTSGSPLSPALNGQSTPPTNSTSESTDQTTPALRPYNLDSLNSQTSSDQNRHGRLEINNTQDVSPRDDPVASFLGTTIREPLVMQGEEDLRFLMSYKDYIFPLLHPFYHPSFFEGGHNWLLVSAMRNSESRQLIVSLTTYFFSIVPVFPGPGFQLCSKFTWAEAERQSEQAFRGMQQRVESLGQRGVSANLWESTHLLGDIMLLLEFETMTQYSQVWSIHLDAAIILFGQILSSPELESIIWRAFNPANLSAEEVGRLTPATTQSFSSSQVAFRFFSASIIIADIVSSTALEQKPRLQKHYGRLMGGSEKTSLSLRDVTGCENWVYTAIAEVVELDVWKKHAKKSGTYSLMSLVQRAGKIIEKLDIGLSGLTNDARDMKDNHSGLFGELTLLRNLHPPLDAYNIITRIWANATKLYLLVVLSGWQPESNEILELVSLNVDLLGGLRYPSWLMMLTWPFCVTACLATQGQEEEVGRLFSTTKPLSNVGGLSEAMKIAKAMWKQRGEINTESWDMAACFQSLGRVPLLI
ncbi:hypothetical protein FSARC_534 [Fusarium sarcochroum]|uniref:Zn(2)-C6 fungal-type domain-containing protein n=1 Tax=Fusarium sarcochroum TaxID=1208366 RepID=A0A8H4UBV2_9HYPO|nr:hypothetical protein FSARC_534 [Fusarium sarcochroum]